MQKSEYFLPGLCAGVPFQVISSEPQKGQTICLSIRVSDLQLRQCSDGTERRAVIKLLRDMFETQQDKG